MFKLGRFLSVVELFINKVWFKICFRADIIIERYEYYKEKPDKELCVEMSGSKKGYWMQYWCLKVRSLIIDIE